MGRTSPAGMSISPEWSSWGQSCRNDTCTCSICALSVGNAPFHVDFYTLIFPMRACKGSALDFFHPQYLLAHTVRLCVHNSPCNLCLYIWMRHTNLEELCCNRINRANKPLIPNFIYIHMPRVPFSKRVKTKSQQQLRSHSNESCAKLQSGKKESRNGNTSHSCNWKVFYALGS